MSNVVCRSGYAIDFTPRIVALITNRQRSSGATRAKSESSPPSRYTG